MRNEVHLEGWVGEPPQDYPERDGKPRFVKFVLGLNPPKSEKSAQWVTVNAYGEVADRIVDGFRTCEGDKVKLHGYLSSRTANPGCGRHHRFTVIVASGFDPLEGSRSRPEKRWRDAPLPPEIDRKRRPF
jgi:hypothetical protein